MCCSATAPAASNDAHGSSEASSAAAPGLLQTVLLALSDPTNTLPLNPVAKSALRSFIAAAPFLAAVLVVAVFLGYSPLVALRTMAAKCLSTRPRREQPSIDKSCRS